MENKKSYTKEIIAGIVTTVIGSIILALLPDVRSFVAGILDTVRKFFSAVWTFFVSDSNMPWGLIVLLFFLSPSVLSKFVKKLILKDDDQNTTLSLRDYKEDMVFGVFWKWDDLYSTRLSGFRSTCHTRLIIKRKGDGYFDDYQTIFYCETCRRDRLTLDGDVDFSRGTVWRQIERRVNTGEWKQSIIRKNN